MVATSAGYRDARPVQQGRPSDPRWYGARVPDRGGWRPDLDAWPVRLVVAFALAAANGVWLLLDRNSPSFDQASYLRLTVLYNRAVADAGPDVLFDTVRAMDAGRGPLYTVALMPWLRRGCGCSPVTDSQSACRASPIRRSIAVRPPPAVSESQKWWSTRSASSGSSVKPPSASSVDLRTT